MNAFPPGSLATVRIHGKGRRERVLPLWRETQQALRRWISARGTVTEETLFLNRLGEPLSRDGLALMVAKHVRQASMVCPSLLSKRVTPHVLRHSCAAHTLAATRSEEHTSELQSLMRISYAVFCLNNKKK